MCRWKGSDRIRARDREQNALESPEFRQRVRECEAARQWSLDPVDAALQTLNAKQRHAFVLIELYDFTAVEAADELGVPEGTARRLVHEARESLKRRVA